MDNTDLKGIFSALLISFDENGHINEQGIREIIRHNIDKMKIDGLYVGGSTGENFMLSTEEKKEIFRIAKDEVKNDVRLIAQVGSINVKEAVELAKYVTELGYDAISAVTPFYYKFSFSEIKEYYNTIVNSCNNRMIIYSIPFLTNVNMDVSQFGELLENKNIIGIKFTAADFFLLERTRKAFPDKLLWAGFDEMMLPALSLNVDGAIGSTFNVNGIRARQIFNLAQEGKFSEALELQHITNDLIEAILNNGLYSTLKNILEEQGVNAGYCRRPMASSTPEQKAKAKEIYQKYLV
ncbi:MAG: N-acetylneuraminate lyase [Clostridia bacterium]|jgi:N-acetylneuraminate lyase|nr:N-acetylneuraminate lyase [Clostridia bacterium]NDO19715.1 N-acetylneuraminate lyase [Lachnospiraceae bacterium MD329]